MMKVFASYNIKGGVGKTAVAVTLADAAARSNYRTLLWDLDEQGAAGALLGQRPDRGQRQARRSSRLGDHIVATGWQGVDLLRADSLIHLVDRHDRPRRLRELLDKLEADFDAVIVDCPPTLGDLTRQIFELADIIVVPIVPSPLSQQAFEHLQSYRETLGGSQPELLPIFSMVDRRRRSHREALEAFPDRIAIPYASAVEQMGIRCLPIASFAPRSPAAGPFAALWNRVQQRLDA
jgi:chromosome partitioning protein